MLNEMLGSLPFTKNVKIRAETKYVGRSYRERVELFSDVRAYLRPGWPSTDAARSVTGRVRVVGRVKSGTTERPGVASILARIICIITSERKAP